MAPKPQKDQTFWFSESVPEHLCSCLCLARAGGYRAAGASSLAVELLAVLSLIWLRAAEPHNRGQRPGITVECPGIVDNAGSRYVVHKLVTSTQPGAAILTVLARRLESFGAEATLHWVPRDANTWADALSKGGHGGFDQSLRRRAPGQLFAEVERWADLAMAGAQSADELDLLIRTLRPY